MSEPQQEIFIRPEILAAKMAAVRNFQAPKVREQLIKYPRLFELLWFIQAMSLLPGGLIKFVETFLAACFTRIGTPAMHAVSSDTPYTHKQREAIVNDIPRFNWIECKNEETARWLDSNFWDKASPRTAAAYFDPPSQEEKQRAGAFLSKLNRQYFFDLCRNYALVHLPGHLARVCNEPESTLDDVWYLRGLPDALFEMMETHAARALASVAQTEITLKIQDAVKYASEERALVFILGDPRTGKSITIKTLCAAWRGRLLLITVPPSSSLPDLIRAFADALGLEYTFRTKARELQARVEYIIRHCDLTFILDEAHWLFPSNFTANTPPMRLNWLRSRLVDQGCPVVLVATPQEFNRCKDKYVKATSHRIEQFMGRKMLDIILPTELDADDLMAVAKIHFPDLNDDFLQVIVGTAMRSESYLMAVEALAKRVRYIARRDNHPTVTLADLKLAISEIIPAPPVPGGGRQPQTIAAPDAQRPLARKRPRPIRRAPAPADPSRHSFATAEAPPRSITPTATLNPI